MKHHSFLPLALVLFVAPCLTALRAAEQFTLEPKIYVFKTSDLPEANGKAPSAETKSPTIIYKSPATIKFAQESLTLDGAEFRWSNGKTEPTNINPVSAPPLKMTVDQPVTLRCASSAQYMERLDNGGFQLRAIAPDSPDAPRYVLTFSVRPSPNEADSLLVSCTPEIAIVQGRDKIAGVELEIGKPVMAVFKDKLEFTAHLNEWVGLLFRSPNDSDYSVLTLVKITRDKLQGLAPKLPSKSPATELAMERQAKIDGGRSVNVLIQTNVTAAGEKLVPPSKVHPAYYIAYDAGYRDLVPMNTREKPPTAAIIDQTLRSALATQGYQPATSLTPPSLVLICYRYASGMDDIRSGGQGDGNSPAISIYDRVVLSAYDAADLGRHEGTLLWRAQTFAERREITVLQAQSTLVACTGIQCGSISNQTTSVRAPLLMQNPTDEVIGSESAPFPIPAEWVVQIDDALVRRLMQDEWTGIIKGTNFDGILRRLEKDRMENDWSGGRRI